MTNTTEFVENVERRAVGQEKKIGLSVVVGQNKKI